ncbi:cytochrome b N-terminal domain-containing protein [Planctomycetota bacterium]|nr:cytochrome b N-terminal domain-containing protein [Planctomycetota bacterium]
MNGSSQSSVEIKAELEEELEQELVKRKTSQIKLEAQPEPSTVSGLLAMAILSCVAVLAGTGTLMSLAYAPNLEDANASVAWYSAGVFGQLSRGAHFHASNLLIVLSASYLGWLAWSGLFRKPAQGGWYRATLLLVLVALISLTGQMLPMDQFALHGTNIRLGYLADTPVIGGWLRELAQGGDSIGTATLTRSYALHIIVLPTILLLLCRGLLAQTKSVQSTATLAAVALFTLVLVFGMGVMSPAPLGLAGDLTESYPEARPEWFALPLYQLLKWLPTTLVLFVPPILGAVVVFALPMLETAQTDPPKFQKFVRIGLVVTTLFGGTLAAIPMFSDMGNDTGYFVTYNVEDVMDAMGKRNDSLGNSDDPLPEATPTLARDLQILHHRLIRNYPDKITDAEKTDWDKWANNGLALAEEIRFASDDTTRRELRVKLREVCENCHEAHDEEVDLDPPANVRVLIKEVTIAPPPLTDWFDALKIKTTQPIPTRKNSTKSYMSRSKIRLRTLLRLAGAASGEPKYSREQAFVDMDFAVKQFHDDWQDNEATHESKSEWDEFMQTLNLRVAELQKANAENIVKRLDAVGKACDDCHDKGMWDEDFDWSYVSLKQ